MAYDLVAASLTYSLVLPDSALNPGDYFKFSYKIFNGGSELAVGPASAAVLLSSDLSYSPDDLVLFTYTYTSLPYYFGHNVTVLIPTSFAPGRYNLIFQIDTLGQIAETNEINNTQVVANLIFNRADLTTNSAADLFEDHGKLAFMAQLAAAAYQLTTDELIIDGINHENPDIFPYYHAISEDLTLLDATDIPALARTDVQDTNFPVAGLRNGIYTNHNAAALVARSTDAMFIAFRGTNDNNGEMGVPFSPAPETPDGDHWFGKKAHFVLFEAMLTAVADYMKEFGLTTLYVTGHSLGAAMVQAFVKSINNADAVDKPFGSITVIADTFASPGYGVAGQTASNFDNLWIDGDPILKASRLADNVGDANRIYHNLDNQIIALDLTKTNLLGFEVQQSNKEKLGLLHSVTYYADFAAALAREGIGQNALSKSSLHNIDYDRVFINATVKGNGRWIEFDKRDDSIAGSWKDDIILGLEGHDTLRGGSGRDHIQGAKNLDWLYGDSETDYLYGGDGADRLYGGSSRDALTGGAGFDRFFFMHTEYFGTPPTTGIPGSPPVPDSLSDTITDFETGLDRIILANIDPSLAEGDQAFTFIGQDVFTATTAEIRYSHSANGNTLVRGDINGDGSVDFTITLDGHIDLQAGDFVL